MPLQFDTSKKAENDLVLEKHVPLRITEKNYVYLMTNDYSVIAEKLKSFQCRIPQPEDFKENPALAKNVRAKMAALGATWSLTITLEIARELLSGEKKTVEPIEIGKNPETDKMIYFYPTGRYGAYISSNKVNVSVTEQPDLETAIDLINNKKSAARKFVKGKK